MTKIPTFIPPTPESRWTKERMMRGAKGALGIGMVAIGALNVAESFRTVHNCTPTYTRSEIQMPGIVPQAPYEAITFLGAHAGSATCRDFERRNQRDPREGLFETCTDDYSRLFQRNSRP